ncbi:MAG: SPASM domain-containing protein, partial [Minisyncoccia bacterium]
GEFRMCNQSQLVFGTLPDEKIEDIWNKPELDVFRDLSWVGEPCRSCELLLDCTGGCKVDANCSDKFCIDYAVRGLSKPAAELAAKVKHRQPTDSYPANYRIFQPNRYMKLTTRYPDKFLVTRYQTVKLDKTALEMAQAILHETVTDERELIARFTDRVDECETRLFVSKMLQVKAVDLTKETGHVIVPQNQSIETLPQFYEALDGLYRDIEQDCKECQDPDCMGYVWLLKQEADGLYECGVPLVQINNGPTFIHSFPANAQGQLNLSVRYPPCSQLCADNRRCKIHQDRPLTCRLYPLGFETKADGTIVLALHRDCLYARRLEERGLLPDFEFHARNILNNLSPKLMEEIVETYRAVYAVSSFCYGENNYKEVCHVKMCRSPG